MKVVKELENPQKSHGNLEIEMVIELYETLPYDFMAKTVAVLLVLQSPSAVDAVRAPPAGGGATKYVKIFCSNLQWFF